MDYDEIRKQLPEHWELAVEDRIDPYNADVDRDYDKPSFNRIDWKARIYYNLNPSDDCIFTIKFDYHDDGQCMLTLQESIDFADKYLHQHPLEYSKCCKCEATAVWYYMPDGTNRDRFYCAIHVPRGCSCNIMSDGEEELEDVDGVLRLLPCCEFLDNPHGFPIEKN